jgi:Holliday junction resolvase
MQTFTKRAQQRVHELAEEYRSKGYDVVEEPAPTQLPDFLAGYHPDLLLRKGDKAVVVEVKSQSTLAKNSQIRDLARVLHAKPGWNFELVLVREEERMATPEKSRSFEKEDIVHSLETAEKLLAAESAEAALLLTWAAVEALIRLLTEQEGITLDRLSPDYLLKQALTNGIIARDDYRALLYILKFRNAVAHGFKTPDFTPAIANDLLSTARRLLQSMLA